jgi:holliday junction DNA helicase RuvA
MIASLSGQIRNIAVDSCVVEVSGIGIKVLITPATSREISLGSAATFFTSLIVREDSLTLFGFLNETERVTFELLQTVAGIGPKVAMGIVATLAPEELTRAIAAEDLATLERIPGIGKKGAQRLVLELKGKISFSHSAIHEMPSSSPWRNSLQGALSTLGYSPKEADSAVSVLASALAKEGVAPENMELGDLLKRVLTQGGSK